MKLHNEIIAMCFVIVTLIILAVCLSGCTTTKTIEVPVAIPCAKPGNIPTPHDYLQDLNKDAGAQQFVPACLATVEDYKSAYTACMAYHEVK